MQFLPLYVHSRLASSLYHLNLAIARKLKCDGGKPACSQCFKRSNPCDYMAGHKRRGNGKRRRADDGSDSEGDGEGDSAAPSAELEPPQSLSLSMSDRVKTEGRETHALAQSVVWETLELNSGVRFSCLYCYMSATIRTTRYCAN